MSKNTPPESGETPNSKGPRRMSSGTRKGQAVERKRKGFPVQEEALATVPIKDWRKGMKKQQWRNL